MIIYTDLLYVLCSFRKLCSLIIQARNLRKPHAVLVAGERKEGSRPPKFIEFRFILQVGRRGWIGDSHVKPVWSISSANRTEMLPFLPIFHQNVKFLCAPVALRGLRQPFASRIPGPGRSSSAQMRLSFTGPISSRMPCVRESSA